MIKLLTNSVAEMSTTIARPISEVANIGHRRALRLLPEGCLEASLSGGKTKCTEFL